MLIPEGSAVGINVSDINKIFGILKARPVSDPSSQGYNIFNAKRVPILKFNSSSSLRRAREAGGFIYGQDIMLRDAFLKTRGAAKINGEVSRALALIHEVVHLTGKSDAFFGGYSKLNDVVIHACFSKIYGHNDLAIVGN